MKTFLITGYPRSRTAWLSNFLTTGPSFCFHELGCHCGVDKFPKIFLQPNTEHVGVAESRAVIYFDRFMELFPDSKVVVIRRNKKDVIASLKRWDFNFSTDVYDEKLEHIVNSGFDVLEVEFQDMEVMDVWHHCLPGVAVNGLRMRMLQRFDISLTDVQMELHKIPKFFF